MSWRNSDGGDFGWGSEFKYEDWECPVKVGDSYNYQIRAWDAYQETSSFFLVSIKGKVTEVTKNRNNSYDIVMECVKSYAQSDCDGNIIDGGVCGEKFTTVTRTLLFTEWEEVKNNFKGEEVKIINCTPHAITVADTTFEPSGMVIRVEMETSQLPTIDGFAVETARPKGIIGLPDEESGIYYLVSAMVLEAGKALGRKDLIAPNTNKAVRNEKGHIISVPGFVA